MVKKNRNRRVLLFFGFFCCSISKESMNYCFVLCFLSLLYVPYAEKNYILHNVEETSFVKMSYVTILSGRAVMNDANLNVNKSGSFHACLCIFILVFS